MKYIICHYHEIALKGGNRSFFEKKLVQNIKKFLPKETFDFVKRISGRILIKLNERGVKKKKELESILKNIFGIVHFSFADSCKQELKEIKEKSLDLLKDKKFKTFRISTKRSNKEFELTSPEVSKEVGAFIVSKMNKGVDLENFDKNVFIEIVQDYAFVYLKKIKGRGGLPVGVSSNGLVLLSGGIDSPVAAFAAMKRGIETSLIHFHSLPYTKKEAIKKVERLAQSLTKFQFDLKLYLCPFADIQQEILLNCPAEFRVILYRRMMTRIAEKIAQKQKIQTLITGESVGQVASQTLENINAIQSAVDILILRPLIGRDKREIIEIAKDIKTFNISILPYKDCCSRFVPKHPATKARLKDVKRAEKDLEINQRVQQAVEKIKILEFKFKEK